MQLDIRFYFKVIFADFSDFSQFLPRELGGIKRADVSLAAMSKVIGGTAVEGFFRLRVKV